MSDIIFKDCEYRYVEDGTLYCKNKQGIETDLSCDNWLNLKMRKCLKKYCKVEKWVILYLKTVNTGM